MKAVHPQRTNEAGDKGDLVKMSREMRDKGICE